MTLTTTQNFDITLTNKAYLVQMPSKFTLIEARELKSQIQQISQTSSTVEKIMLDFGQTTFLDSSGLIGLCQIINEIKRADINLAFWSFSSEVNMILSLAGLDQIWQAEVGTDAVSFNKKVGAIKGKNPFHPSIYSKSKRLLDICGALVGLGITAILIIPIAIAIQLDNPGSILFSQMRCGHMGKKFRIWKFRSMVANAEELQHQVKNQVKGPLFKNESDPRITRVGKFLRKTSLDEFPQFWNVLKGEMSLVGTRPPTEKEVDRYEIAYGQRLDVKPGLTGEWQVSGRSSIKDFKDVLNLDLQYQQNWSLLHDLKLIFKTIGVIFSPKSGAY
ncbi:MAG: sugar transferase [Pleurocapsa sp. MO_192.B19]|nr:sugar transferase [Pleurocapsa sp. MO_192.B19]